MGCVCIGLVSGLCVPCTGVLSLVDLFQAPQLYGDDNLVGDRTVDVERKKIEVRFD